MQIIALCDPSPGGSGSLMQKLLRIMKISVIILLSASLAATATGRSQVSLSEKNVPLQKVFQEIHRQSGYDFLYPADLLLHAGTVTVEVHDVPLETALMAILKGTALAFTINDKTIIIKQKINATAVNRTYDSISVAYSVVDIRGHVESENGEPLPGINVFVKGTSRGTTTDEKGEFRLKKVNGNAVLVFSSVNIETIEINVEGKTDLVVRAKKSVNSLNETVVIAYGTTTKRLNVGSVSTVNAEEIARQPVANVLQALESNVPGLQITQNSGVPGSGLTVQIRGRNSINNAGSPLFIVDGVQVQPNQDQYGVNPFSNIAPNDVESISVLKDADATAIYGSRGANGVILITTKHGQPGVTKLDLNIYSGVNKYARVQPLLNTDQYLEMRNEAFKNDGIVPDQNNAGDLTGYGINSDVHRYTDWVKALLGQPSHSTDAALSLSGGSARTTFLLGGTLHRETAPVPGNYAYDRPSVHFNVNHSSEDRRLTLSLNSSYAVTNSSISSADITSSIFYAPNFPSQRNPDGSFYFLPGYYNPYASLAQPSRTKNKNLIVSGTIGYRLLPGLELRSSFGYTDAQYNNTITSPLSTLDPASGQQSGYATYVTVNNGSWQIEPQLEYKRAIFGGRFSMLAGATLQGVTNQTQGLSEFNFPSDALLNNPSAGGTPSVSFSYSNYRYAALFGRLNYTLSDKYLLNITARRDGSSRFGPGRQFGDFWSAGAGWIFSEEGWIHRALHFLSFGKLRASYGLTGNDQIGDYQYLDTYSTGSGSNQLTYDNMTTFMPTRLYNPDFGWEVTKKLEIGLDAGFVGDRIRVSADWYRNRSSSQLINYSLAPTTGFNGIVRNLPATVGNNGWEFTLNTANIQGKKFRWNTAINLTIPHNKLLAYPNLANSSYANVFVIGQPLSIKKVYHYLGVDPQTGIYTFADKDGKTTSAPKPVTDQQVLINTDRQYYGSLSNTVQYGPWQLSFDFMFVKQIAKDPSFTNAPGFPNNQPVTVLDRWQKAGDKTNTEKFTEEFASPAYTAFVYAGGSERAYMSASYIRLKNVALSFAFDKTWLRRLHCSNARLYVNAQNWLTATHYRGNDPENQGNSTLPPLKTVVGGIQLTF